MSWKQVRVFVLALIFGAVLVVLLKVILATLAEKGKGKSATRLPRVEFPVWQSSVEIRHGASFRTNHKLDNLFPGVRKKR